MCDIADGRYFYTLAGSDEAPPVKRAPQGIPFLPCRRERHALVGTAVFQRMHATLTIPKQQQWLIAEHRCEGPAGPDRSAFRGNVPETFEHAVLWLQPPSVSRVSLRLRRMQVKIGVSRSV